MSGGTWWRVEVTTHDGQLVAIEPEMLAGKGNLTDAELEIVRNAGWNLLGFAGDGRPQPCFYCGGSGEIETDNNGPIGPCPICDPNTSLTGGCAAQENHDGK